MAYTITQVGPNGTDAYGINNEGQVPVYEQPSIGNINSFIWQSGQLTSLPADKSVPINFALGLNDSGEAVGYSQVSTLSNRQAVYWQSGVRHSVSSNLGGHDTIGYGVNNSGQIVGTSTVAGDRDGHAFLWDKGTMTDLGMLPGAVPNVMDHYSSGAIAINDNGQVVGYSTTGTATRHAVLWQNGNITDLGLPSSDVSPFALNSTAWAINNKGQVVGDYYSQDTSDARPALWQNGTMISLGMATGWTAAVPHAINNSGQVVGYAQSNYSTATETAVLWQNGAPIDLNTLLPAGSGWVLKIATGINDQGQIVGLGTYDGAAASFELTPGGPPADPSAGWPTPTSPSVVVLNTVGAPQTAVTTPNITVISNPTDVQMTLATGTTSVKVVGGGYDIADLSSFQSNLFSLSPNSDGSLFAASLDKKVQDTLSGIVAVKFADKTMIVAPHFSTNEYIALLYQGALGRQPDPAGLAAWEKTGSGLSATPASLATVQGICGNGSLASGFTGSPEFQQKYGTLSNDQFIAQMYANVLDRPPDGAGLTAWEGAINGGMSRDAVLVGFATSTEAANNASLGFTGQSGVHPPWLFLV